MLSILSVSVKRILPILFYQYILYTVAMVEPKYRRSLNATQLAILHELYRFRIGTTQLLSTALQSANKNLLNRKLTVLLEQNYIARIYDPSYRLSHQHASFFLSAKGVKELKKIPEKNYSPRVLANIKRLKHPSDKFVDHVLGVFEACNLIKARIGDDVRLFTKSELVDFEYFPEQRPDAFIRLKTANGEQQYILEYLETNTPFRVILGKLKSYINYSDEGGWEVTNSPLPPVLLVCDSVALEKRVQKYGMTAIEEADDEVLRFYTTNLPALQAQATPSWTSLQDLDEKLQMQKIA